MCRLIKYLFLFLLLLINFLISAPAFSQNYIINCSLQESGNREEYRMERIFDYQGEACLYPGCS